MKYKTLDATFRIRGRTQEERDEDAAYAASLNDEERDQGKDWESIRGGPGEFRVNVSPVGNGWWTRKEVESLRDRLTALLEEGK